MVPIAKMIQVKKEFEKQPQKFPVLWLLGLAAVGIALLLYATRWGAFLSDDSFWYIHPAEQALRGEGFNPTRSFAPGLSLMLILLGSFGLQLLEGVRWLNAALFGFNLFLSGWIVWRAGGGQVGTLLAGLAVMLSDVLLEAHGWAMSEALNLMFSLLALMAFQEFIRKGHWGWLAASALSASLACLTRYAGISIVAAIALGLLVYNNSVRGIGGRLWRAAAFGAASLLPMAAWLLRNRLVTGQALHYSGFQWAWPSLDTLRWFIYSTLSWFIPGRLIRGREFIAGLAVLALLILLLCLWLRGIRKAKRALATVLDPALFVLLANGVLVVAMLVIANGFSNLTAFNARYLIPLLLALLVTTAAVVGKAFPGLAPTWKFLLLVGVGLFLLYYGYRSQDTVRALHTNGLGYVNRFSAESETVRYLKNHPDLKVITTGPEGMYFWTGIFYEGIYSYGSGTDDLIDKVCEERATLVILKSMPASLYGLDETRLTQKLNHFQSFNDSDLYTCQP